MDEPLNILGDIPNVRFQKVCSYLGYKERCAVRTASEDLKGRVDACWHVREKWQPLVEKYGLPKTASYYGPMSEVAAFLPKEAQKHLWELIKPQSLTAFLVIGDERVISRRLKIELELLGPTFRFSVMGKRHGYIVTFSPTAPPTAFMYLNPEGARYVSISTGDIPKQIADILAYRTALYSPDIAIPEVVRSGRIPKARRGDIEKMKAFFRGEISRGEHNSNALARAMRELGEEERLAAEARRDLVTGLVLIGSGCLLATLMIWGVIKMRRYQLALATTSFR